MSTLVIIVGLSDFGPGRAILLSKIINSLGYDYVIVTNEPIYLKKNEGSLISNIIQLKVNVPSYNSLLGRLLFYLLFSLLSFLEILKLTRDKRYKQIFIITRHPYPLSIISSLMAKWLLKIDRQVVVIADITDLWPESFTFMLKTPLVNPIVYFTKALNYIFYPKVDGLITHNKYYDIYVRIMYLRKKGIPSAIIPHSVDLNSFRPIQKVKALSKIDKYFTKKEIFTILNNFIIGYAGLLSESIGSDLLIPIIKKVISKNRQIVFLIVGEGPFKQKILNEIRCENLILKDPLPHHLIRYVLNLFDVGIITSYYHERSPATLYWHPKKLGEYAACGKPIIYVGYSKFITSLIRKYNCGFAMEPKSLNCLVYYLSRIREDYESFSNGALRMAKIEFSLESAKTKMRQFLARFSGDI